MRSLKDATTIREVFCRKRIYSPHFCPGTSGPPLHPAVPARESRKLELKDRGLNSAGVLNSMKAVPKAARAVLSCNDLAKASSLSVSPLVRARS